MKITMNEIFEAIASLLCIRVVNEDATDECSSTYRKVKVDEKTKEVFINALKSDINVKMKTLEVNDFVEYKFDVVEGANKELQEVLTKLPRINNKYLFLQNIYFYAVVTKKENKKTFWRLEDVSSTIIRAAYKNRK